MKKLCAKQNWRAKQWGLAKFANTSQSVRKLSEFGNAIANLEMVLRSWKWCCEVGNVVAKLARLFAKLAMRNFAKLLEVLCEKRSSQMHSECV